MFYLRLPGWLYPLHYQEQIGHSAESAGIDPYLICAVIETESNWDSSAVSSAGAQGLMQLMPETAAWIAGKNGVTFEEAKLAEPEYNISLGSLYLDWLLEYWQGDVTLTAAAYNAGLNNVQAWLDEGVWDGNAETTADIPFAETSHYTEKLLRAYDYYHRIYGEGTIFSEQP